MKRETTLFQLILDGQSSGHWYVTFEVFSFLLLALSLSMVHTTYVHYAAFLHYCLRLSAKILNYHSSNFASMVHVCIKKNFLKFHQTSCMVVTSLSLSLSLSLVGAEERRGGGRRRLSTGHESGAGVAPRVHRSRCHNYSH